MRIISGTARGRALRTAHDEGLRPAMGKTREALFSMLEARGMGCENAVVLDLFAGCGSLAFECLSRGASSAWLVDNGAPAHNCLVANATLLGMENRCRIIKMDVPRFLAGHAPAPFDIVFIDPPYRRNLAATCLERLARGKWLAPGAFVVAETENDIALNAPSTLAPAVERRFGQTRLCIWTNQ